MLRTMPPRPIRFRTMKSTRLVDFVTSGGKASWEPKPDLGWTEDEALSEVDDDALQLHRNKGEEDGDSTEEDKLREEMLNDDEEDEDEDGVDGGEEPPI